MNIKSLGTWQKEINSLLDKFFKEKLLKSTNHTPEIIKVINDIKEYTLRGGKRIRPALIYNTYKLFKDENSNDVLNLSIFIELIQSWVLIHDDIIDRSNERRGYKAFHKEYQDFALNNNIPNPDQFGNSVGILAGDLTSVWAYQIISESNFDSNIKLSLLNYVFKKLPLVMFGEFNDLLFMSSDNLNEKEILNMYDQKTAEYTFTIPIISGAILADCDEKYYAPLENYARNLGIAFQIRDDILGVFGDEQKTGKSNEDDIKEGKKTLLILKARELGTQEQVNIIDNYLGKTDISKEEIYKLKDIIKETHSLEYNLKLCEKLIEESIIQLSELPNQNSPHIEFFYDIANYVKIRDL